MHESLLTVRHETMRIYIGNQNPTAPPPPPYLSLLGTARIGKWLLISSIVNKSRPSGYYDRTCNGKQ